MRNPGRNCTVCLSHDKRVDARFVATATDGMQWYECGEHEPHDNVAGATRASLTPIDEWFASITPEAIEAEQARLRDKFDLIGEVYLLRRLLTNDERARVRAAATPEDAAEVLRQIGALAR